MKFNSSENIQRKDNTKKKGKKVVIILIIFLLIILVATYVVYSHYAKNMQKEMIKNEFFASIKNNDLSFFLKNDLYTAMEEKVEKENYETNFSMKFSTTMENNMFSKLDLSKFEFYYDVSKNRDENRFFSKISTKYAGNDLLALDFIGNEKEFAVKSDEIVNKYVGINQENTQKMADALMESTVDLSTLKKLQNFVMDRETIDLNRISNHLMTNHYGEILKDTISSAEISKKENVLVPMDSEQISTTEYMVELSSEQTKALLTNLSETLEHDDELLSQLVVSKVQNFENDEGEILEYTDNENTVGISGEESNFNTSVMVWPENNEENASNSIANNIGNSVSNTSVMPNNNTVSNTTVLNQVPVDIAQPTNPSEENPQTPVQEQPQPGETSTSEDTAEPTSETNHETSNTGIQEEDNFRTQGFIEVNEESSEEDDETPFIIGENYEDTIKNISNLAKKINWFSYLMTISKVNCTQEELLEELQKILSTRIKQNNRLMIKTYVSENKTIKINFEIPETEETFDVEIISKKDNEKYLNITSLLGKDENASGQRISLYKKQEDADMKTKIAIQKIHKNKINQKFNVDLDTKGTVNSKKFSTDISVLYSDHDGEFKANIENALNFDVTPEIEEINNENCLFLDTISNEELLLTRDAIKQKTMDVLKEKNRNLNIIEINTDNSVVEQTEQNTQSEEDLEAKNQAKQRLIQTISNKMREYLNRGTELKIEDLEDLQIPDYEVEISISSNLAIITVNGYKFKLDSDFNLSDS